MCCYRRAWLKSLTLSKLDAARLDTALGVVIASRVVFMVQAIEVLAMFTSPRQRSAAETSAEPHVSHVQPAASLRWIVVEAPTSLLFPSFAVSNVTLGKQTLSYSVHDRDSLQLSFDYYVARQDGFRGDDDSVRRRTRICFEGG